MSLSQEIINRLKESLKSCPTCGLGQVGIREHAKSIGVSSATLWRITNGQAFDSKTLDKISNYLKLELKPSVAGEEQET